MESLSSEIASLNIQGEYVKKNHQVKILELKNKMNQMKIIKDRLNRRMERTKERISELKNRKTKITQP